LQELFYHAINREYTAYI